MGAGGMNITPVRWRTGHPEAGQIVFVWHLNATIRATWDGKTWRTTEGDVLTEVTHWRPLRD